jgi:hypothetical protein
MTVWSWPGGHLELLADRGRVGQVVLDGVPAFWVDDDPDGWNVGGAELASTGERMTKIGVPPDVFAGRLRYSRPVPGGVSHVERVIDVWPDRRYCDLPVGADPAAQGDAVQVFDDDGHYGGYAELEHHSPAVVGIGRTVDVCTTTVRLTRS